MRAPLALAATSSSGPGDAVREKSARRPMPSDGSAAVAAGSATECAPREYLSLSGDAGRALELALHAVLGGHVDRGVRLGVPAIARRRGGVVRERACRGVRVDLRAHRE